MQDAHDSARAVGHRTERSVGAAARIARPRRHPSRRHRPPTSSSSLYARAHMRGCTLLHALPARKRLRPLSPHAYLPTRSARIAPTKSGVASRRLLPLHCCRFVRPHTRNTPHGTRNTPHATRSMQHSTCNMQHATLHMQRAAYTAKSRRAPRRSLPRRCRKFACRRVGCRCMCAVVTNGLRG